MKFCPDLQLSAAGPPVRGQKLHQFHAVLFISACGQRHRLFYRSPVWAVFCKAADIDVLYADYFSAAVVFDIAGQVADTDFCL